MSVASASGGNLSAGEQRIRAIQQEYKQLFGRPQNKPVIEHPKPSVSIIISASSAWEYIEECLDSIVKQTHFIQSKNYEILVGVNNCQSTLNKLMEIKSKYENLSVYFMSKGRSPYIVLNTLVTLAKSDNILNFNAEDIMKPEMIEEIMVHIHEFDLIKFDYREFRGGTNNLLNNKFWFNGGICLFKRKVFDLAGGFKGWVRAGDVEFIQRVYTRANVKEVEKVLYYKRQLTHHYKLGISKHPRKEFLQKIRRYRINEDIKIPLETTEYKKIISGKELDVQLERNTENFIKDFIASSKKVETFIKPNKKESVSILIAAYKAEKFIEQCLDSIETQTYFKDFDEYEILIGVDACQDTFSKLQEINHRYRNLNVFMMKENKGPYVTFNTLFDLIKYENIIIFGADDVMMPFMVDEIMSSSFNTDLIRFGFVDFKDNINVTYRPITSTAWGAIFMKKSVIDLAGGYQPWRCSADYEFIKRVENHIKIGQISKPIFYRRDHPDSLSNKNDTGLNGNLRKEYNTIVRNYRYNPINIKINKIINEYTDIQNKKINVIISAYDCEEFIEECLDSIQNQTYPAHKILLGIDGCIKTLEKVREIRHKYTNLNVYYSENNTGPYQVFNALMELVPDDEYIQRFDADDIMNPNMLEEMSKYDVPAVSRHDGVLFIKKEIINQLGGFRNWRCAADSDMVTRISILFNKKDITRTLKYFILRQHDKQLTKHSDTNLNSDLRKQYTEIINKNKNSKKPDIYIKPIFSDLKKLKNYMDYNFVLSKKTISVNLSTYPARKTSLIKSLNNLLTIDTIDIIRVYLNEYKEIPANFPKRNKILYLIGKENLKDSGKFYWAENLKNEYYFTIDDDLIYPDQYFIEHIKLLDQYKGNIFVSLHGKVMRPNPINFNDVSEFYHCLAKVKNDVWVNNGGTGVMVFDNSKFTIPISIFKFHGMTDLWIAYYCQQNKIPILCRKHEETELKYLLDKEETLFDQRKQLDVYHQKVLKMIKTWNLYKL